LYYTASGIITPVGDRPVHRLREDWVECIPSSGGENCTIQTLVSSHLYK